MKSKLNIQHETTIQSPQLQQQNSCNSNQFDEELAEEFEMTTNKILSQNNENSEKTRQLFNLYIRSNSSNSSSGCSSESLLDFELSKLSLRDSEKLEKFSCVDSGCYSNSYSDLSIKHSLSSSNGNSLCSSPSSSNSPTHAPTHLQDSNTATAILNSSHQDQVKLISGYSGRAKNQDLIQNENYIIADNLVNDSVLEKLNFGDDVGFLLRKNANNTYYFGIADGVSANRLRGYDARLFPIALLNACTNYILNNQNFEHFNAESFLQISSTSSSSESLKNTQLFDLDLDNLESQKAKKNKPNFDLNELEEEPAEMEDEDEEEFDDYENNDECYTSADDELIEEESKNLKEKSECSYLYNVLLNAHNLVQDDRVYGSSTVCLLSLKAFDNYSVLSTCNLGDSGYMIIRDKKVIFKSQSQSHRFNAPFQLGCTPPELLEHDLYRDKADDSIPNTHAIKSGDFLIISTDGLFDNLYEDEIALIIHDHINTALNTQKTSCSHNNNNTTFFTNQNTNSNDSSIEADKNDENNDKTTVNTNNLKINSDLLNSTCDLLVQKASKAGIKRDDMLIMLIYIE